MQIALQINPELIDAVDRQLAKLGILNRQPAIKQGVRNMANVVRRRVRETLPKPGYPGDKPGLKPLRDTAATKVVEYPSGVVVGLVGFEWGAGSHGHLVELGHRMVVGGRVPRLGKTQKTVIAPPAVLKAMGLSPEGTMTGRVVGFVQGKHYLEHASRSTESEQSAAMEKAIEEAIGTQ